jgi:hypothetical protein
MTVFTPARWFSVLALLVLSGCGPREPASADERRVASAQGWLHYTDAGQGYSVRFPESWHRATERMSRIGDPRELLSLGTVPLSWHRTDCEAFAGAAGVSMGPRDVVLTLWERGYDRGSDWVAFPSRPQRFGPVAEPESAARGCGEPGRTIIHWRNFSDSGRHFHTLVRVGRDAPPNETALVWHILDSLRFDPNYRPRWAGSG